MRTRYFFALAAVVLLASCNKELQTPEIVISKDVTVLEVGMAPVSKTYMGEAAEGVRKVYWSNGDVIAVNGVASDALAELEDNTASASFTFQGLLSAPYNVLYPASIYKSEGEVELPAVQEYKAGGFADGVLPMAGYSEDGSGITIDNLCAILKVSVKQAATDADKDDIVSVRFKGRNDEQVSGVFAIDYQKAVLNATSTAAADKEVKVVKSQATSVDAAAVYFIVVPAGEYVNGFDVVVKDKNGHIMTKSKTSAKTLEAGHLYDMAAFEFVPTATEIGVEINSAAALVQFATDFNNKVYASLGDEPLVAALTADIVFDAETSAAFNATGGIGKKEGVGGATGDLYFDGVFDGGNYTISGLEATVPLFVATGSGSTVKDFKVDNTCSFTFTHPGTQTEVGSIIGYHKGLLSGVTVTATVSLSEAEKVKADTRLGGLVGRIREGVVDNCTYSGALSVPSGFSAADKQISIGGLVGNVSNAAGKIQNSFFKGTIDNEGQMIASSESSTFKNEPQLMIGGIVGNSYGTVSNCTASNHATGVTVTINDGSDHDYTGTVVTHSTNAYHYAIAGIAGRNDGTVTTCTNNAAIVNIFAAERGTGGNMNGRFLNVGGIVGFNKATVSGSDNYGAIVDRANPKIHYVGGIVGRNVGGSISSCDNKSTGAIAVGTSHTSPYGARMLNVGGVLAFNEAGTVSNIHNEASIAVSRIENTTGIFAKIGGVIGSSYIAVDGSANGGTITNTGAVSQSSAIGMCATPTDANDYGLFLGGIIGYTTAGVNNVTNFGNVTYTCTANGIGAQYVHVAGIAGKVMAASPVDVEKCTNSGNVTFTASAKHQGNDATRYYYNYLGGIVGYAKNVNIKGDASAKCSNSALVKGGDSSDNNNQPAPSFMVGGIVGYITGNSSIDYCELTGTANPYNDHWSNRGITSYDCPTVGGIAGQIVGAEGAVIPVSNCALSGTAVINARRGAVGGVVGLAQYAEISNCTVPINLNGTQSGYFYGGIAAAAQNSTVSSCTYLGTTIQSSQIQIGGGIVGQLDAASTVDGCRSSATTINKNGTAVTTTGGIAGKSVAGSTIKNSHYTSTIGKLCGDANFTDGGGNVADL